MFICHLLFGRRVYGGRRGEDLMYPACWWKQVGGQAAKPTGRQSAVAIGLAYGPNYILGKQKGKMKSGIQMMTRFHGNRDATHWRIINEDSDPHQRLPHPAGKHVFEG